MRRKALALFTLSALILILSGLWIAGPAAGGAVSRVDPTSQQATVDASVQTLFAQTAMPTLDMTQAVAAAFNAAQTATAAALPPAPAQPVSADTVQVAQVIELPLLAAPGSTSAYLAPTGDRIAYLGGNSLCILDIAAVAADIQTAIDTGTAAEHALDGLTDHPDQFKGVACVSLADLPERFDTETIRWSPDGRWLVMTGNFFKYLRDTDLWVLDTQSMILADITDDNVTKFDFLNTDSAKPPVDLLPHWMPDGRLVFIRYTGQGKVFDPPSVYTIQPDGSGLQQTGPLDVPAGLTVTALAVSAEGKLAYYLWKDEDHPDREGIWISDLDGSHAHQLWNQGADRQNAPLVVDWSPDGQYVAFASSIAILYGVRTTPEYSYWRAVRVSDGQEILFSTDQSVWSAGWSPDGGAVIYTTRNIQDLASVGLYIAAAPGAPGRMLVSAQADVNGPGYSLMSTTSLQEQLIPWVAHNTVMIGRGGRPGILIIRLAAP